MSVARKTLRGVGWIASSSYLNMIVAFGGNLVLSRILIPEEFGVFALAYSFLALVAMFAGFGSQEAIVQCRDEALQPYLVSTAFWITAGFNLLLAIVGTIIGWGLSFFYEIQITQLVVALAWMNFLFNVASIYEMVLQRDMQYRAVALIMTVSTIISFGIAIYLAVTGWGVWALFIRELVARLIQMIMWRVASRVRIEWVYDRSTAEWIWSFGWRLMFTRISEVLFSRVDNLVVGTFIGTAALGHYNMAYRLSHLGQQATEGALTTLVFSTFSAVQDDPKKLAFGFERLNFWLWRIVLPGGILVLFIGQTLVSWVYGEQWQLAGQVFQQMFLFLIALPVFGAIRQFCIGAGYVNLIIRARFVQLAAFIITISIAAAVGTLPAIVIAVTIAFLTGILYVIWHLPAIIKINWAYLVAKPLIATIAAIIVGFAWQQAGINARFSAQIVQLLTHSAAILGVYCACLLAIEYKSVRREWQLIRRQMN